MSTRPSLLVIRLSSLGDVLFGVPALQLLQDSGRFGRIAWLVEDRAAVVLKHLVTLDELVVFPRSRARAWAGHFARLRGRRDDVVLDLQCNMKSRIQRLVMGGRQIGYAPPMAKEGGHRGLDELHVLPAGARHRVASHLSILRRLGIEPPRVAPRPRLNVPEDALERARAVYDQARGDGPRAAFVLGTSAYGAFKRWEPARFAALGRVLQERHGARVSVIGGPGEDDLVAGARLEGDVAPPPTGMVDMAAQLQVADVVVAADSLGLHMANGLGTPVAALFGPKDPRVNGPYFDRSEVVRAGSACSPCTLRRCSDRLCMDGITVDAVAAACDRLLAAGRT